MPSGAAAIANYESMAQLIRKMVEAAVAEEWERLAEIEHDYALTAERMRIADADAVLTDAQNAVKQRLIQEILAGDRLVRERVEAWMNNFRKDRDAQRQSRRVKSAYGV